MDETTYTEVAGRRCDSCGTSPARMVDHPTAGHVWACAEHVALAEQMAALVREGIEQAERAQVTEREAMRRLTDRAQAEGRARRERAARMERAWEAAHVAAGARPAPAEVVDDGPEVRSFADIAHHAAIVQHEVTVGLEDVQRLHRTDAYRHLDAVQHARRADVLAGQVERLAAQVAEMAERLTWQAEVAERRAIAAEVVAELGPDPAEVAAQEAADLAGILGQVGPLAIEGPGPERLAEMLGAALRPLVAFRDAHLDAGDREGRPAWWVEAADHLDDAFSAADLAVRALLDTDDDDDEGPTLDDEILRDLENRG